MWITGYDLPDVTEAGRDEYLAWLHDAHIPTVDKFEDQSGFAPDAFTTLAHLAISLLM